MATSRWSRLYLAIALPCVVMAFYAIDHRWDASVYFSTVTLDYDGSENLTVTSQQTQHMAPVLGRLGLIALGLIGLMIPTRDKLRLRQGLIWTLVAYYGWLAASLLWSVEPQFTLYKLAVLATFLIASLGLARAFNGTQLVWLFTTSCGLLIAIGVVAELSQGTITWHDEYRFAGTSHPNTEAIYAAMLCLGSTLLMGKGQRMPWPLIALMLFGTGFAVLLVSKSRTALAALAVALVAIAWVRGRGIQRGMLVVAALVVVAMAGLMLTITASRTDARLAEILTLGRDDSDVATLTGRVPLWDELLDQYQQRPWLGYGYLAFWSPDQIDELGDQFGWEIPHGHNMYLDVLLDGGLIGLGLFVAMLLVALFTAWRRFDRSADPSLAIVVGLICFVLVHGWGESLFKMVNFPSFMLTTLIVRMAWPSQAAAGDRGAEEQDVPTARAPALPTVP